MDMSFSVTLICGLDSLSGSLERQTSPFSPESATTKGQPRSKSLPASESSMADGFSPANTIAHQRTRFAREVVRCPTYKSTDESLVEGAAAEGIGGGSIFVVRNFRSGRSSLGWHHHLARPVEDSVSISVGPAGHTSMAHESLICLSNHQKL